VDGLVKRKFHTIFKKHIAVIILYIVLTIILTYPLLFLPSRALLGQPGDNMQHLWTPWQTKQALMSKSEGIFHTKYIFHPEGTSLLLHAVHPLNNFILLLFNLFFSLEYSYNLNIFLSFFLNALGAYYLCYYFTKDRVASFIGGFIFGFSPYQFTRALNHSYYASNYIFPLIFLLFFSLRDKPNLKKGALIAFLIIITPLLTDYYYLAFTLSFLFFGLFYYFIIAKAKSNREFLKLFLIAIGIALIALSPLITSTLLELNKNHYLHEGGTNIFVLDSFSFFTPSPLHPLWGRYTEEIYQRFTGNPCEATGYLGVAVVFLSFYGLIRWKGRKDDKSFFLWLIVITIILSMGASIHFLGHYKFSLDNRLFNALKLKEILHQFGYHKDFIGIPLPYILIRKIPILESALRAPARWIILTYLCLSIAAAFGLKALYYDNKKMRKIIIAALFFALILFEYLALPLDYSQFYLPPFYYEIQKDQTRYAILDIPFAEKLRKGSNYVANNYYQYLQTIHGKPIPIGQISRISKEMLHFLSCSGIYDFISLKNSDNLDINILKKEKIKFIVLHKKFIEDQSIRTKYINNLNSQLQTYYQDENINVYKIY